MSIQNFNIRCISLLLSSHFKKTFPIWSLSCHVISAIFFFSGLLWRNSKNIIITLIYFQGCFSCHLQSSSSKREMRTKIELKRYIYVYIRKSSLTCWYKLRKKVANTEQKLQQWFLIAYEKIYILPIFLENIKHHPMLNKILKLHEKILEGKSWSIK